MITIYEDERIRKNEGASKKKKKRENKKSLTQGT
jgi:hypothetical protein